MQVIEPITTDIFRPYAKKATTNGKLQTRVCNLLFRLIQTDSTAKVKELCLAEVAWLESEYSNSSTRKRYVTDFRNVLKGYFAEHQPPASLMSERQTSKGPISQHCALDFLMASPEDYAESSASTREKTAAQRDNLIPFNAADALEATKQALESDNWRELAAGLIMAVQCRPSDMLKAGKFKAISKYRLEFTTSLKKRGKPVTGKIFCLVDTITFMDAFSRLRREPDVMEIRGWSLKDVDSAKNKTLNRAVRRVFGAERDGGEILPPPYGEKELSCKNLRSAGVDIALWLHGRENQQKPRFLELQLFHESTATAASYEDYYPVDASGKRLLQVGVLKDEPLDAKPQSEQRSSIRVDAQLRDMIADAQQWGEGSHADRLERIIARAYQADKLERQLARECVKRLRAELELKRLEQAAPVAADESADEPSGFDWRDVSNDELNGDRRRDAYAEKLRRSVEAIEEYNAGRELVEQYSINSSSLRQMTKVKPDKVKEWMLAHNAELDSYSAAQGHTYQQNKGKCDIREAIKWNEQAYGAYDW